MSTSPYKPTLTPLHPHQRTKRSPAIDYPLMKHYAQWLIPGISVKRWLLITIVGVFFAVIGFGTWVNLKPVYWLMEWAGQVLKILALFVPNQVSGPLVLALGLFLIFWGHTRSLAAVSRALRPETETKELVDVLVAQRRLNRGPKIVAIGGGTGLSTLLRGLKFYSSNITAIVTVADDGGSSGRLRRDFGVLPPGDIRNCIAALADEEKLLTELFQYRFEAGDGLVGHSFGNLFLTAMTEITGDLERAIAASSKVLAIRGRVLPATLSDVDLWAKLSDGRVIEGESKISEAGGKIEEIGYIPPHPPALPAVVDAIYKADYIIIGPGSLYTSVIPNLLVPEIAEAIAAVDVPCIYVCNIMTQKGETVDYSVADHIRAIDQACGGVRLFDGVLVQKMNPSEKAIERYAKDYCAPVFLDREEIKKLGRRILAVNVMDENDKGYVRHNSRRLAKSLMYYYHRAQESPIVPHHKQMRSA